MSRWNRRHDTERLLTMCIEAIRRAVYTGSARSLFFSLTFWPSCIVGPLCRSPLWDRDAYEVIDDFRAGRDLKLLSFGCVIDDL